MDSDEEDFLFYGTPIEREEDIATRKKKAVAEASGQLRTLVPWKQEVIIAAHFVFFVVFLINFVVRPTLFSQN